MSELAPYVFAREPFPYQRDEWEASKDEKARAIFWEQGLGKSKVTIDTACHLYLTGQIDAVAVIAPNGVHRNWVEEEIPAHAPPSVLAQIRAMAYSSDKAATKRHQRAVIDLIKHRGLAWLTISYEAFMTKNGKEAMIELLDQRRVFYILDEGHYIKNVASKRTESILMSAKYAAFRRVLTGTPIAVGPFDIFPCMEFLQPGFWQSQGFSTFIEFKKHFGVFKKVRNDTAWIKDPSTEQWRQGGMVDVLDGFRRLDELSETILPLSSRLTKEDSGLNLPPKKYRKARFPMSDEQTELYRQMRDESVAWIGAGMPTGESGDLFEGQPLQAVLPKGCPSCGDTKEVNADGYIYPCPECCPNGVDLEPDGVPVVATMAMVRLLRLQQITCGYLPNPEDLENPIYVIPGENRRLNYACNIIEKRVKVNLRKVIVWARFTLDIDLILAELKRRGISAVRYDGQVDETGRDNAKALFKGSRPIMDSGTLIGREDIPREQQADVWVANQSAGATGLTLTIAKTVMYYSNNFKLIDRLQSEDRAHRIGQDEEVEYIDMMADDTIDDKIIDSHREKLSIASEILGDKFREWI